MLKLSIRTATFCLFSVLIFFLDSKVSLSSRNSDPTFALISLRHFQGSFTPPNANNSHTVFAKAVNNAERGKDNLSQVHDSKFRYNTAALRKLSESYEYLILFDCIHFPLNGFLMGYLIALIKRPVKQKFGKI